MKYFNRIANLSLPSSSSDLSPSKLLVNLIGYFQVIFNSLVKVFTPIRARKVVIVGQGILANKLYKFFQSGRSFGYEFCGFYDIQSNTPGVKGNIEDLKEFCLKNEVDEIYFTRNHSNSNLVKELIEFSDKNFIYFRIAHHNQDFTNTLKPIKTYYYDDVPVMRLRKEPLASRFNQGLKRAFDIVFSTLVLMVLIPFVFPFIALAIYFEDPGPIFFVQKRPGKKNKLFNCFKFRSMRVNNDGEKQASKNDSRITKVGAFLRKTSLDELPQFINVLLGDMSVVGPRPNMVKQLEFYSQHIDNYSFRHFVTPGITGYAQVNGFRGETQTIDLMEKRVQFDIAYMEKWSLWFDLKIIFLTAWNMVAGEENAY